MTLITLRLAGIRAVLSEKGYLLLDCAENTLSLDNTLIRRTAGQAVFYL